VILSSSSPQLAAVTKSVLVQAGASSATFVIQTTAVAVNSNVAGGASSVNISGSIGRLPGAVAKLTVLPAVLTSLALDPSSVPSGISSKGTVTISGPAPAGGLVINLSDRSNVRKDTPNANLQNLSLGEALRKRGPVTFPPQITIAPGSTTAMFTVTTRPVSATTAHEIDAAQGTLATKAATLTLQPPKLDSVSVSPQYLIGGTPATATAILSGPAPEEGWPLHVIISGQHLTCGTVPTGPSTIQVPGGSATVSFPVTTYPGYGQVTIQVNYGNLYGAAARTGGP
jgi:hypothetical protein